MTYLRIAILLALGLILPCPLHADAAKLQSAMIWSPTAPAGTQAYVAFRESFNLTRPPTGPATLQLFADSRYLLWVNGNQILRGPSRFNPKGPEYDNIDIKPYLQTGANSMVLLVHHYAGAINGRIMAHSPGLAALLEADGKEILRTDSSWRSSNSTEYRPSPSAWSSIPDVIDARQSPGAWTTTGFDDRSWTPAVRVDGTAWGTLQARTTPLPVETELTGVRKLPEGAAIAGVMPIELDSNIHPVHGGPQTARQSFVLDLGRMAMAYPIIELEADAGSVLQLQYALRFVNGKPAETYGVGTTYTARAGRQRFIAADQWCAHYVTVTCVSGRVKLLGLKMMDRRYPYERVGSFQCNDPMLNRLWEMSVNTIEVTTDDAHGSDARERNEWVQDGSKASFNTIRVASVGPDGQGGRIYSDPRTLRKLLRDSALSQLPDGRMLGTFPTDRGASDPHYVIEDYAFQWIEALHWYHDLTGDNVFLREMWPVLTAQMQWFLDHIGTHGLLCAREYTSFDNPMAYITCEGANINAFFYQGLRDAAYLGGVLHETSRANAYTAAADKLYATFNARLWNGEARAYSAGYLKDTKLGPTVHAQLMALYSGLVPSDRMAASRAWFVANYKNPGSFHCGNNPDADRMIVQKSGINMPIMYYWVFHELYRMNTAEMDREVIAEMRRRWTPMVKFLQDAGTVSENFVNGDGGGISESCHNYGAVPAYFLSSYVLGVRRDGPVWNKHLLIEPRLGDLTSAAGVVATSFGPVPVSWKWQGNELTFQVGLPPGANATLRIPDGDAATWVCLGSQAVPRQDGRFAVVTIGPGKCTGKLKRISHLLGR